jgi:hypothetical protein
VNDRSKSSGTYDITWDTDTIQMKDRGTLNTQDALLELYLASTQPKSLVDEFSRSFKILDAEYKPAVLKEVYNTPLIYIVDQESILL